MIVAVAVSSGFRSEVRGALSQMGGDIQLCPSNLSLLDEAFKRLTSYEKAILRNKAAVGDFSGAAVILKIAGVKQDEVYL